MDARVNVADNLSASGKSLVSFDPVTPEFYTCVCAGRATFWALHAKLERPRVDVAPATLAT